MVSLEPFEILVYGVLMKPIRGNIDISQRPTQSFSDTHAACAKTISPFSCSTTALRGLEFRLSSLGLRV